MGYYQDGNGQFSLFEPEFIKDRDCTIHTPVIRGKEENPVYGKSIRIRPGLPGRMDTKYMEDVFLPELMPLEAYDLIVVLLSGGKDSIACYFKLSELGVPKSKIEFWTHDIDGGHPSRRMDWRCTINYVRALAEAEHVPLRGAATEIAASPVYAPWSFPPFKGRTRIFSCARVHMWRGMRRNPISFLRDGGILRLGSAEVLWPHLPPPNVRFYRCTMLNDKKIPAWYNYRTKAGLGMFFFSFGRILR